MARWGSWCWCCTSGSSPFSHLTSGRRGQRDQEESVQGTGLERLTFAESFAAFPMFSRDGGRLVFCSNRGAAAPREYNVFVADWADY
jgi:hypothetical protein